MSIVGISTFETEKYISERDPSNTLEEGATVFELGSLDVDIKTRITDNSVRMIQTANGTEIKPNQNGSLLEAVRFGLRGWENFKDKRNNNIPFETEQTQVNGKLYQQVKQSSLNHLPMSLIKELGQKILDLNSVDSQLVGKSGTA